MVPATEPKKGGDQYGSRKEADDWPWRVANRERAGNQNERKQKRAESWRH